MAYPKKPALKVQTPTDSREKRVLSLRRSASVGFDWAAVDGDLLRAALLAATQEGAAVMISAAAGGRGVCIKVYVDDDKVIEYATDAEELNQLLEQVVVQLAREGLLLVDVVKGTPRRPITMRDVEEHDRVHAAVKRAKRDMADTDPASDAATAADGGAGE